MEKNCTTSTSFLKFLHTNGNTKTVERCGGSKDQTVAVADDFNTLKHNGDAYADCVENNTPWNEFKLVHSNTGNVKQYDYKKQYLLVHMGGHGGIGFSLVTYNFSYDEVKLQHSFRKNLKKVYYNSNSQYDGTRVLKDINSNEPIVLQLYPFETGLTILANSSGLEKLTGRPKEFRNVLNDVSSLAWNRAFQAKNALSITQDIESKNQKHWIS